MQEVLIKPRCAFKHDVRIEQSNKLLEWTFTTKHKSVSFGLFKKESELASSTSAPNLPSLAQSFSSASLRNVSSSRASASISPPPLVPTNLTEILPITHYQSSKNTINGSYLVKEPGIYVLVFDNTFSINTSKKLLFSVNVVSPPPPTTNPQLPASTVSLSTLYEGFVYKKGNKKIQGYSKRWLVIHHDGTIQYFKRLGGLSRGSIKLTHGQSAVHIDSVYMTISIDNGANIFHLKCYPKSEFDAIVTVIESFFPKDSTGNAEKRVLKNSPGSSYVESKNDDGMDELRANLDFLIATNLKAGIDKILEAVDGVNKYKGKHVKDLTSFITTITNETNSLKATNDTLRISMSDYNRHVLQLYQNYSALLSEHNRLRGRLGLPSQQEQPLASSSSLSNQQTRQGDGVLKRNPSHAPSFTSMISYDEKSEIYYDAFESRRSSTNPSTPRNGSPIIESDEESEEEGELEEAEEEDQSTMDLPTEKQCVSFSSTNQSMTTTTINDSMSTTITTTTNREVEQVITRKKSTMLRKERRTALPSPTLDMENISIMSILRNNVGKDLSTVTMPIALNELAEELEYSSLLDQACGEEDVVERMMLVCAFVVSAYAGTQPRAGRKPFNPLLGETFEFVRDDKGFKYIAEKVSHHPPIMACYAEGKQWSFWQESHVKTKFWGKSMELIPKGLVHVLLNGRGEHYTFSKVTTCMRNVFSSSRYLEHYGTTTVTNHKTGHYANLEFKESGYFSSSKNEIIGSIYSSKNEKLCSLRGKWDERLEKYHDSNPNLNEVVWRPNPFPHNYQENYGFTSMAIELNELTSDLKLLLPPTDTRYRPDQRMYENGDIENAEMEKTRLEDKQRKVKASGVKQEPRWFTLVEKEENIKEDCLGGGNKVWKFNGEYFKMRGNFPTDLPDLF